MNQLKSFASTKLPLYLFALMLLGLLCSRALLSVSTGLWIICIVAGFSRDQFKKYKTLLIWSLVPVALFFLGWYQQISAKETYDYLLTLMMYPVIAFASISLNDTNGRAKKAWLILGIASIVYPLSVYVFRFAEMNVLYGQGQSLPTLMDGDHVRYGIFLNATLMMTLLIRNIKPKVRILLILILVSAIIVMSVRTAWVGLAIIVLSFLFFQPPNIKFNRWILLLIIPVFGLAYLFFPAVSQKIKYTIYDWQQYSASTYNPDFSDGARRTVNHVAAKAIVEGNSNVGWAGVPEALQQTFKENYPGQHLDYGWPFNQWLFWGLGSGWVGRLLFTIWLFLPLCYGIKKKNYFLITWTLIIATSCIVESTLNLQYGVFLHAWPLAFFWIDDIQNRHKHEEVSDRKDDEI